MHSDTKLVLRALPYLEALSSPSSMEVLRNQKVLTNLCLVWLLDKSPGEEKEYPRNHSDLSENGEQ